MLESTLQGIISSDFVLTVVRSIAMLTFAMQLQYNLTVNIAED